MIIIYEPESPSDKPSSKLHDVDPFGLISKAKHFDGFLIRPFFSGHWLMKFNVTVFAVAFFSERPVLMIVMSSVYATTEPGNILSRREFMYFINRVGLSKLLCGTPVSSWCLSEVVSAYFVDWQQLVRYDLNQDTVKLLAFVSLLLQSISKLIVSNAQL